MKSKHASGKSRSSGSGHNAAKQARSGRRYDRFYPDVPIPEIKNGGKEIPSLLAMAFGIKERGE